MRELLLPILLLSLLTLQACSSSPTPSTTWSIAIHGGAGVIDKSAPPEEREAYTRSLTTALELGRDELARGGTALDAVEKVVQNLEDNPLFNAGKGAVFTYDGTHELDASIMDGSNLHCGAVAGVKTIKNPIGLARLVMEKSPHVLLMGDGAEQFAAKMSVERVENSYFDTPKRREQWEKRRRDLDAAQHAATSDIPHPTSAMRFGTVGAVALDSHDNLAAATSTGGLTCKRWGRVGDTPVIGAGTYADSHAAISCTGTGEEFIRHGVARQIAMLVEMNRSAAQAADAVVNHKLKPDDGGVIVVSRTGEIAMVFNSDGMFRGAADSRGRFDVSIWDKPEVLK